MQNMHEISIHAPRMGSDPRAFHVDVTVNDISIHAPRMGSDKDEKNIAKHA